MFPEPLQAHSVNMILQYISPPSQLDRPLPPHIISKPLLQRHHFLQISPEDTQRYLCWPSKEDARALYLLEQLPRPSDDHDVEYPVQYSADAEDAYAHVQIVSGDEGLRLVFQWDHTDGWRYHDAGIMPFPPNTHTSLENALANYLAGTSVEDSHSQLFHRPSSEHIQESDDDAYWRAYGGDENDARPTETHSSRKDEGGNEDAYWAQYASVQGSGDSTMPSPQASTRRKLQPAAPTDQPAQENNIITFSYSAMHPPTRPSNGEPPSPNALTDRLNFISSNRAASDSYLLHEANTSNIINTPPEPGFDIAPTGQGATVDDSRLEGDESYRSVRMDTYEGNVINGNERHVGDEGDLALEATIRGIYDLWKIERRKRTHITGDMESGREFLNIVKRAIESG